MKFKYTKDDIYAAYDNAMAWQPGQPTPNPASSMMDRLLAAAKAKQAVQIAARNTVSTQPEEISGA